MTIYSNGTDYPSRMRLNVNGLFNDAVSSKDCIELNDMMIYA
jgi:hypothetical protein